jgi:hypothetical protein
MEFTKEEREKLEQAKILFKVDELTREQIKLITGRYPPEVPPSETNAVREARRKPKDYSIKRLFKPPQHSQRSKTKPNFQWSDIAKHASKKAERRQSQKQDNIFRLAKLFRDNKNSYRIEKTGEYYYNKYKAMRSEWKVFGDIDIFQVHDVISELVNRITAGLPENVKLQVVLENTQNDRINQTKLLSKQDIIYKLSDWVNFFTDYYDTKIEDMTFKLMAIEIPTGAGRLTKLLQLKARGPLFK